MSDEFEPAPVTFAKVVLQRCGQESCVHELCNLAHVVIDYDRQLAVIARERDEAEAKLDRIHSTFQKFCVCNCYGCAKQCDCCKGCLEAQDIVRQRLASASDHAVGFMDGIFKIAKSEIELLKELLDEACNLAENGYSYLLPPTTPAVLTPVFAANKLARVLEIRRFQDDRYRRAERQKRFGK